ncbi:SGNH/GDSL hydrolase family protein [Leucobacter sp. NPDC077196]|uniref:SGNH/GDSL hydrolase family protein n=1 Tax=Leucobacter sp. NPDC077196 TaxID=3154959 RepID=UPI003418EF6A
MMPAGVPRDGARALVLSAAAAVARVLGWRTLYDRVNRPLMELAEMQPVTAQWWRERRKQQGTFRYLALGDSTAQGIGASVPGRSYVGQLIDRIEARTGEPVKVVNLAVSGATTTLCLRDQLPKAQKVLAYEPDLVTIAIGANDIAEWDPVRFHRNLTLILSALPTHTIVSELPCFHLPWNERKVRVANRILHTIAAERGLRVVPLHRTTQERGVRGVLTEFAADAFHPNDRGYEVWADAFWPFVEQRIAAVS